MSFQAAFKETCSLQLDVCRVKDYHFLWCDINLKSTCSGISVPKHQILSCFACIYVNTHKLPFDILSHQNNIKIDIHASTPHHNTFLFLDAIVRVSADQHKTGPPSFGAKTIVFEFRRNILIFSHINPPKTNVNKQENEL